MKYSAAESVLYYNNVTLLSTKSCGRSLKLKIKQSGFI